ncbi:MAG: amidoligase family protein, partial [Planctomycetota bacterium]
GGDRAAVARDLYREGLIPTPQQQGYHSHTRRPGMWSYEQDGSVTGGEIVSPVMRDTPEAWRQIERVCEIVRRHGGQATHRCGLHVHVGSAPLDTSARRWYRLVRVAGGYEDVLFRIAAGGSSGGEHRGAHRGYGYARPGLALRVRPQMPISPAAAGATEQVIHRVLSPGGHYEAVNASGHFSRGTVEFRHFDGTLDPAQIQAYVKVANGVVQAAQRLRSARAEAALPDRGMPVGSGASGADPEHRAVRRFLDTIFGRTRDKAHLLWLYATSRWQPA